MGFKVTAASVGDYRPRFDRRVARSKARSRDVRRKEAPRVRRHLRTLTTARSHTDSGRSKSLPRKKETCRVRRMWQAGKEEGRHIETLRETREQENGQIGKERRSREDEIREGERWPRARPFDTSERVAEEGEERVYICYHRAGKAKDLYFRSFLLGHERKRMEKQEVRDKEGEAVELERARARGCQWQKKKKKKKTTMTRREDQGRWTEGRGAQLSESGQDK